MSKDSNFSAPMAEPVKPMPHKAPGTSGKAIASLVLGLLSIVGMCLTGIPGLILGIMGLGDIGKSGGRVGGKGLAIAGIVLSSLGTFALPVIGILIGMLLPAVQQVRQAARTVTSQNNVRQQVLGMLNYESAHMKFPLQDNNGLSWRVHILPYMDHQHLYQQFNLEEPWDSPNNIALLPQMPIFYDCPSVGHLPPGFTVYQVPYTDVSDGSNPEFRALFENSGEGVKFREITDGMSNTIAVVEVDAAAAVEWTKPADWEYDPSDPMHDLGNVNPGRIIVGMADGSVNTVPTDVNPAQFDAMTTRNGGEEIDASNLR